METDRVLTSHTSPGQCMQALLALDNQQCKVQGCTLLGKSGCWGITQPQVSPCLASGSQVSWLVKNVEAGSGTCGTLDCHDWYYQLERYTVSSELCC